MEGLLLKGDIVYLAPMGESEKKRKNIVVGENFRVSGFLLLSLSLGSSVL